MENVQNIPIDIQTSKLVDIHYFHCLRIVEDWQEILSLYEKDNAYLAEVASLLSRSVSYEGPALRKQVAKAQQQQQDLSRRELECQSSSADLRERYYAACKQYGITGENVARELQALVKDLPSVLDEAGRDAAQLEEHIRLYTVFTNFVSDWSEQVLPLLSFVQKKGNTTSYEWRTGNPPVVVEKPVMEEAPADTVTEETEDEGAIDWGDNPVEIEVLDGGTDCPEGVARGEDALTILENPQSRAQFIDELMELETFLAHRLAEMGEEADVVSMNQFQLAPSVIQGQSREHMQALQGVVSQLLGRLTSLRMQHLFMILASPRYVERVSETLRQKLKQADILVLKRTSLAESRQKALEEQARLEPRVDLLAKTTRELQKLIEADISKRYNSRPVNLMGVNV
ncbi:hypothetical protein CRUP_023256 [Coryphaenoides rupestris]|nr:hypothetical protein CRUP_023256 [Coryphaenoides rupestris]